MFPYFKAYLLCVEAYRIYSGIMSLFIPKILVKFWEGKQNILKRFLNGCVL